MLSSVRSDSATQNDIGVTKLTNRPNGAKISHSDGNASHLPVSRWTVTYYLFHLYDILTYEACQRVNQDSEDTIVLYKCRLCVTLQYYPL